LLAGDIQPTDEVASYEFTDKILDIFEKFNGKEIITLGGIGLATILHWQLKRNYKKIQKWNKNK